MSETERIQVVLPRKLAGEVRRQVPARTRSAWIAKAIQDRLMAERRLEAIDRAFGTWSDEDFPNLGSEEDIEAWRMALWSGNESGTALMAGRASARKKPGRRSA